MISTKNVSTSITVFLTLLIIVVVMMIAMTATTEADSGFHMSASERSAMNEYYQNCPLSKAQLDDAKSPESIRKFVKFTDLSCDPEQHIEQVAVRLLGEDKERSRSEFVSWLEKNELKEGESLKVVVE